jgi:hypothetical protein
MLFGLVRDTYDVLALFENQLLVQLRKVEQVFRLATLDIDTTQEGTDLLDDLRQSGLVWMLLRGVLQDGLEE